MTKESEESHQSKDIQSAAIRRVEQRMPWKPSHPLEEEIFEVAVERAGHLLKGEDEE